MAGHSKFKTIKHRKEAKDNKRQKLFNKMLREITTAIKLGSPKPEENARLRTALVNARKINFPKENIDRAIKKATDPRDTVKYSEIRYDGRFPGGVAIIVEALTDNKSRTGAQIKHAFSKYGGETGMCDYLFKHCGIIEYPLKLGSSDEVLGIAIEAGADDVVSDDTTHTFYTDIKVFPKVLDYLVKKYNEPEDSYIGWVPLQTVIIDNKDSAEKLLKIIELLEDNDDIQRVYGNYELSDKVYEQLKDN